MPARDIRGTPAFQAGGEFSPEAYFRAVRSAFRDTPQGYEEMRRRSLVAGRLKQLVFQSAKLAPSELETLYAQDRGPADKDFQKALDIVEVEARRGFIEDVERPAGSALGEFGGELHALRFSSR